MRRLVEILQEEPPLLGRQRRPVHLLDVRALQLAVADAHAGATGAAQARCQSLGATRREQVDHRGRDQRIAGQVTVRHARVGGAGARKRCAGRGNRAVTVPGERVHELIAHPCHRGDRFLAGAGDQGEALIRGRQLRARGTRGGEQLGARARPAVRPVLRIEEVDAHAVASRAAGRRDSERS